VRRVGRDTVLFVVGLAGIGYQQITGKVHWELLVVFGLMIGLPGISSLIQLVAGGSDITPSSSSSPPQASSPSSSSSSPST
jgi:hypothetical protein